MPNKPPAKLLIVDDEAALTTALCKTLRDEGYESTTCTSGQAAMEALREVEFDLLLTDLMMPGMDGIALLQAALKLDPNLVGILMTAHATVPTAVKAMKVGALDYILKPFKLAAILPVINRALEIRRLRNENIQLRQALSIYQSSMSTAFTLNFNTVLDNIANATVEQCEAAHVSFLLPTANGKELYVAVTRGSGHDKLLGKRLPINENLTNWISRCRISAAEHRDEIDLGPAVDHPWRDLWSGISLPMLAGGSLVGVLIFESLGRRYPVTAGQMRALKILVGIASSALEATTLFSVVKSTEQRYRATFEQAAVGMAEVDLDGRWRRVNQKFCEMLGYSQAEFLERTFQEMTHPDDLERCLACVQRLLNTERQSMAEEKRYLCKNGSPLWVNISLAVVRDGAGAPSYFVAAIEDISERRKAHAMLEATMARLNHLLTTIPTVLYSTRLEGAAVIPTWVSQSITRILGYSTKEALRQDWWPGHLHPEDRDRVIANVSAGLEQGYLIQEYRFLRKDGGVIWVRDELRVLPGAQERPAGEGEADRDVMGSWSDITEQRRADETQRLFTAAFASTHDAVMMTDMEARIILVNQAFQEQTGYAEFEVLGRNPRLLQSGRQDRAFYQAMWASLLKAGHWQGEVWNRRKNGELFPAWNSISTVRDDRGRLTHYVAVYTDISKLKQSEVELQRLAHFDPLTDLPNRLLLQSRLEHSIKQAQRRSGRMAILFIDLDNFKRINDSLGHIFGDELLVQVAKRLGNRIRAGDTVARLGGDEFVVLLETLVKPEEAGAVARDLVECFSAPIQLSAGHEVFVEISIGISIFPEDGTSSTELLRDADMAMYRAKDNGRNQFCFFTSTMSVAVLNQLQVETALRHAIAREELLLHYQPTVDLHTGRMYGAEALLRWRPQDADLVPPVQFIPVAEKTGLIVSIGAWVIDTVCRQIRAWLEAGFPDPHIAVNVSARQFYNSDLEVILVQAFERHGVAPSCLTLELTESMLMDRPGETVALLERLKRIGVQISLDDFGTGFSSLAYLSRFPINTLKIDGTFVRGIETDPTATKIVDSIIDLAHRMGLKVVAECVETESQLFYLREHGCDAIQGYYFSKPVTADEFACLLREGKSLPAIANDGAA